MCKISIVIPVYNVESYICKCLDSLINQTYKNIEIICVNDGSKDKSKEILEQYSKKDSRIIVINKENEGVSVTRNKGLQKSTGDYIMFLDADDYLDENTIEIVESIIKKEKVDLIKFDYKIINQKFGKVRNIIMSDDSKLMNIEDLEYFVINTGNMHNVCNNVYKADIIKSNNIEFPKGIIMAEDFLFNLKYYEYVDKWYYINRPLYNYIQNESSVSFNLSKDKFIKKIEDTIYVYEKIFDLVKNKDKSSSIERKIIYAYNNELRNIVFVKDLKNKIKFIKENTDTVLNRLAGVDNNKVNLEIKLLLRRKYKLYYLYVYILRKIKRLLLV